MKGGIDISALKVLASDHWPAILQAAGIEQRHLGKGHGPCPVCGGKDRFRFTDRGGRGCFVCNKHRPDGGDGFHLLADWLRCDFIGAARFVSDYLGGAGVQAVAPDPAEIAKRKAAEAAEQRRQWEKARRANAALWQAARPICADSPAGHYLANRGLLLADYPKALRWHAAVPYWCRDGGKPVQLGVFAAMLAAVQAQDGSAIALHKTYLTDDGKKAAVPSPKKWGSPSAPPDGAAVRLYPAGERLALAEGIETALAVHCANGLPVWAGLSAHGMTRVALPPQVKEVFVFADLDEGGAGQAAAEKLALRLLDEGRIVRVLLPSTAGRDWLDVLTGDQE